jgi:probable rRNA maturation factor
MPILGDIVICAPIAFKEAEEQDRSVESYWAHLVVHGILHLLGYAHEKDTDAKIMESLESEILVNMNYPTPYEN